MRNPNLSNLTLTDYASMQGMANNPPSVCERDVCWRLRHSHWKYVYPSSYSAPCSFGVLPSISMLTNLLSSVHQSGELETLLEENEIIPKVESQSAPEVEAVKT